MESFADEVSRTVTLSPLFTRPAELVNVHEFILYSHHEIDIGEAVLIPHILMVFEEYGVERDAPVTSFSVKTFGSLSGAGGGPDDSGGVSSYGCPQGRSQIIPHL